MSNFETAKIEIQSNFISNANTYPSAFRNVYEKFRSFDVWVSDRYWKFPLQLALINNRQRSERGKDATLAKDCTRLLIWRGINTKRRFPEVSFSCARRVN